jgi:hypothetical protein
MTLSKATAAGAAVYEEIDNDQPRTISLSRQERRETRYFVVSDANLSSLIAETLPGAGYLPGRHPTVPWLFVDNVEIRGMGRATTVTGGVARWPKYNAVVSYGPLPFSEQDSPPGGGGTGLPFVTHRKTFSAEFMTLPSASLKWQDTDAKVLEDSVSAGKLIPMIEHVITHHRVTSVKESTIRDAIGKVNSGTSFLNAASETLLFMGVETSWTYSTDGSQVFTVEHRFLEKRIQVGETVYGWNHFYRPTDGKFAKLVTKDGDLIHPVTTKFPTLFSAA